MQVLEKRYIWRWGEKKRKRNHSNMVTAFNVFCGAYILFPMNYLQCSGQKEVPPVRQHGLLKQQRTLENYSSYSFENTLPTCPKSKTPESARTPPVQLLAPEYLIVSIRVSVPPSSPPSGWQLESHQPWLTSTRDSFLGSFSKIMTLSFGAVATLEVLRTCLGLKCSL